jgi:hypothetical protein
MIKRHRPEQSTVVLRLPARRSHPLQLNRRPADSPAERLHLPSQLNRAHTEADSGGKCCNKHDNQLCHHNVAPGSAAITYMLSHIGRSTQNEEPGRITSVKVKRPQQLIRANEACHRQVANSSLSVVNRYRGRSVVYLWTLRVAEAVRPSTVHVSGTLCRAREGNTGPVQTSDGEQAETHLSSRGRFARELYLHVLVSVLISKFYILLISLRFCSRCDWYKNNRLFSCSLRKSRQTQLEQLARLPSKSHSTNWRIRTKRRRNLTMSIRQNFFQCQKIFYTRK